MSDAQLVVYNDAGIEQVSLGGINLALVHKETISSSALWTSISGPLQSGLKYSFTVSAKKPVVAVATDQSSKAGGIFAMTTNIGTDSWRIDLFACTSQTQAGSIAGTVQFSAATAAYVFDEAPAPTSGPGLALYDATGKCTFNALYPGVRVKQMLDDPDDVHSYGTSVAIPSGKTYATIMRSNWGTQVIGSRNVTTGDMLANEYRDGVAGGLSGAAVRFGNASGGDFYKYPCFINGSIAVPHGSPGDVGTVYATFGCDDGAGHYFSDGLVIDVTHF